MLTDPFIQKVWEASNGHQLFPVARELLVAHSGLETGWGKSRAFLLGNNLFNITRTPDDPGPVVLAGDLEFHSNGEAPTKIVQRFSAYPTLEASVSDYLLFLTHERYGAALEFLQQGDLGSFVRNLAAGHYFTLPVLAYLRTLSSCLERVEEAVSRLKLE